MEHILLYSDGHGKLPNIPKKYRNGETLIVFAGDQCNNYVQNFQPFIKVGEILIPCEWKEDWNFRKINKEEEAKLQGEWIEKEFLPHLNKQNIDLNRVIWINGNHDFVEASKYFPHSCFNSAKTITIDGIKIGLLVGCLPLVYEWHEEIPESEIENRIKLIDPEIEILVSHAPCYSINDYAYGQEHIGSQSIYASIFGKSVFDPQPPYFNNLKFYLSGHAHKYPNVGVKKHEVNGRIIRFCNAAEQRLELIYTKEATK